MNHTPKIRINPADYFAPEAMLSALLAFVDFDEFPADLIQIHHMRARAILDSIASGATDQAHHLADAAQAEVEAAFALVDSWHRQSRRAG